jgi:transmembrane sensor
MNISDDNIDELITKYLAGEASAEENARVEGWRKESAGNEVWFRKLKMLWEESGAAYTGTEADVDEDRAWRQLESRLDGPAAVPLRQPAPARKVRWLPYLSGLAAMLLIGVGLYFLWLNQAADRRPAVQIAATDTVLTRSLPDNSRVTVNAGSVLSYPETFPAGSRVVNLSGDAYFEVLPDENRPFVVEAGELTVRVLGTSFYVQTSDRSPGIRVGVVDGRVAVTGSRTADTLTLSAGQQAVLDRTNGRLSAPEAFTPNAYYWNTRTLVFSNVPLREVFATLESTFGIRISVADATIGDCRLSARFRNETLEQIMDQIGISFNLRITPGTPYVVAGEGC